MRKLNRSRRAAESSARTVVPSTRRIERPPLEHLGTATPVGTKLPASVIRFPDRLNTRGDRLLDQQVWCWGQDVLRAKRNLLVDYGFLQLRAETPGITTCYRATSRDGISVALWSWGVFFGDVHRGGIFLRRTSISPFLTPSAALPHPHWPEGVYPPHQPPRTPSEAQTAIDLLVDLALWVVHFEEWIESQVGSAYRRDCLRDWPRRVGDERPVADLWRDLAYELKQHRTAAFGELSVANPLVETAGGR